MEAESEKVAKELQGLLVASPAAEAPVAEDTDAAKAILACLALAFLFLSSLLSLQMARI